MMSEVLPAEEYRIDRASQKMLRALGGGEWTYGSELRDAGDLNDNTQVFYRMERYLCPAGLVEELPRDETAAARQFRLTERGSAWVDAHADEILAPTTREEVAEMAQDGYEAGTSAKESVQNYRKKVNRVKNRLDETRDTVTEIADQQENDDRAIEIIWERSKDNRERSLANEDRLTATEQTAEALREAVESRATTETVDGVAENLAGAERQLTAVEAKLARLIRQQATTDRERAQVRHLARSASFLIGGGALVAYLLVLVATLFVASQLVVSVLIAGIGAALGVAVGTSVVAYAWAEGLLPS